MKNLIHYLLLTTIIIIPSCNNEEDNPPAPAAVLSKILENGDPAIELIFDTERKLIRLNDFTESDYSTYTIFKYGPQGIEESQWYDADTDVLNNVQHFTLDNQGRIAAVENFGPQSNFTEVISKSTYTYDASGRILRKHYIYEDDVVYFLEEFTYDANDNLLKSQWTYSLEQPGNEYIGSITEYTPGPNSMYDQLKSIYVLLDACGVERHVLEMFSHSSHDTFFNSDGEITSEYRIDASEQQSGSHGHLTSQILTTNNLLKQEEDIIRELSYEYTE